MFPKRKVFAIKRLSYIDLIPVRFHCITSTQILLYQTIILVPVQVELTCCRGSGGDI